MKGWEKAKLEDYISFIDYRGRTPVKTESGVRLITAKNVKLGYLQLEPQEFIHEDSYETWMTRGIPNRGDIIFTTEAPLANVAQIETDEKLAFAQRIIVMQPRADKLTQSFLKYLLLSPEVRNSILQKGTGATVTGIKSRLLKKIEISLPPIQEQEEIVAILNKGLAALNQAKANIEKNITNAKELFQSKLNEIFSQRGEGWEEKILGDVCDLISGQHIDSKDYNYKNEGIGYLTGPSDFGAKFPIVSKWTNLPKRVARRDDILITVKGSGVGSINLMKEEELCISRQLMAIRCKEVEKDFLFHFLATQYSYFQSLSNGAAIPGISRSDVLGLKLSIPNLPIQKDYVLRINRLQENLFNLILNYQGKISSLEELKKSLLQKAFAGELTQKEQLV